MTNFDIENQPYIQSQYGASPTIKELLNNFRQEISPTADIEQFIADVMNVKTATGYGLDCWARIVGVQREIIIVGTTAPYPLFGFAESGCNPFGQGVFVTFDDLSSQGKSLVVLGDDNLRNLILFKALVNITNGSMAALNKIAYALLNTQDFTVTNVITQAEYPNGDFYNQSPMTVQWTWRGNNVSNLDRALFNKYIEMILPAGVRYQSAIVSKDPLFGFAGSNLQPFGQGVFGKVSQI